MKQEQPGCTLLYTRKVAEFQNALDLYHQVKERFAALGLSGMVSWTEQNIALAIESLNQTSLGQVNESPDE